jgi:spermidine synthase
LLLLYALSLLTSAILLFWMEPMFAKMILPLLGGSPSVWNTCIVFYQTLLLLGYIYAHATTKWLGLRWQAVLHVLFLVLVSITLPVGVAKGWTPPLSSNLVLWLFLLLLFSVGLPFFTLSASAPMLQRWFSLTAHPSAKDPYFLYSASNLGSLIGLLGYPLLIEAYLPLPLQAKSWSASYILLAGMISACAIITLKSLRIGIRHLNSKTTDESCGLKVTQRIRWVLLAFVPSSLLLAVTNYITTDIAQVPLLWIIPLAIYLISFVLVFSPKSVIPHRLMVLAQPFLLVPLAILFYWGFTKIVAWPFIPFHLLVFFITAMVCHGEIAYSRPSTFHLTEYYLWISVGGVLGGLFNTLVAPQVFHSLAEYPLMIAIACLLRPSLDSDRQRPYKRWFDLGLPLASLVLFGLSKIGMRYYVQGRDTVGILELMVFILISCILGLVCFSFRHRPIRFGFGMGAILLAGVLWTGEQEQVLFKERNFFGIHRVVHDSKEGYHLLFHGTTLHGAQSLNPSRRREPLAYYHRTGPLGQVFAVFRKNPDHAQVAIIGLGTGSAAGYANPRQHWTFYEIDPAVERIARDSRYFTFLKDCPAKVSVVLGDARLSLANVTDHSYDLIVLDAFSSDAIPIHLLTREALELYLSKLSKSGVLVFHISNRYLDLKPILGNLANHLNLVCLAQDDMELSEDEKKAKKAPSTWAVMAHRPSDLSQLAADPRWKHLSASPKSTFWTDDFSNIVSVFKWSLPRIKN